MHYRLHHRRHDSSDTHTNGPEAASPLAPKTRNTVHVFARSTVSHKLYLSLTSAYHLISGCAQLA